MKNANLRPLLNELRLRSRLSGPTGSAARKRRDSVERGNSAKIRESARSCAAHLSLNLDRLWEDAKRETESGFIDVIDMFSGCGGMSVGFRAANGLAPTYRHIMAVDVDEVANKTYEANIGLKPMNESVASLRANKSRLRSLIRASGRNEKRPLVLIGCAPCQGFSSHRNSEGQGDERNSLFVDFARIAANLRPAAVVIENVPELLTTKYWPYVTEARRILNASGYSVHLGVYNMADFGVPQERFRAVMLALPQPFLPLRGFLNRSQYRSVRTAIGALPKIRAGEICPTDPMHYSAGHQESTLEVIRAVPKDGGSRPPDVGPPCLVRARERQGRGAYDDVYGRLAWDKPAITITAYARNPASGRFIHPHQDRGLSVREAALLQGFPKNYAFVGSLDERFRQIGNAVPPKFSSYLALYLLGELLSPVPASEMQSGILSPVGASFSRLIPSLKSGRGSDVLQQFNASGSIR